MNKKVLMSFFMILALALSVMSVGGDDVRPSPGGDLGNAVAHGDNFYLVPGSGYGNNVCVQYSDGNRNTRDIDDIAALIAGSLGGTTNPTGEQTNQQKDEIKNGRQTDHSYSTGNTVFTVICQVGQVVWSNSGRFWICTEEPEWCGWKEFSIWGRQPGYDLGLPGLAYVASTGEGKKAIEFELKKYCEGATPVKESRTLVIKGNPPQLDVSFSEIQLTDGEPCTYDKDCPSDTAKNSETVCSDGRCVSCETYAKLNKLIDEETEELKRAAKDLAKDGANQQNFAQLEQTGNNKPGNMFGNGKAAAVNALESLKLDTICCCDSTGCAPIKLDGGWWESETFLNDESGKHLQAALLYCVLIDAAKNEDKSGRTDYPCRGMINGILGENSGSSDPFSPDALAALKNRIGSEESNIQRNLANVQKLAAACKPPIDLKAIFGNCLEKLNAAIGVNQFADGTPQNVCGSGRRLPSPCTVPDRPKVCGEDEPKQDCTECACPGGGGGGSQQSLRMPERTMQDGIQGGVLWAALGGNALARTIIDFYLLRQPTDMVWIRLKLPALGRSTEPEETKFNLLPFIQKQINRFFLGGIKPVEKAPVKEKPGQIPSGTGGGESRRGGVTMIDSPDTVIITPNPTNPEQREELAISYLFSSLAQVC